MLVKHPVVTLVVVFALGVGIPVSLAPHHLMNAILDTPLPKDLCPRRGRRVCRRVTSDY